MKRFIGVFKVINSSSTSHLIVRKKKLWVLVCILNVKACNIVRCDKKIKSDVFLFTTHTSGSSFRRK